MSHVRYLGAVPHQEQVVVGSEQQVLTVTTAGAVLTLSDPIGTYLVTHEPSLWEAAEGWTPPPGSPIEEATMTVSANYTLGPLCKNLFVNATGGNREIEVPPASEYKGQEKQIINLASNGNTVTLKSQGGNIVVPGKTGATTQLVIGAGLTYTAVTLLSDGTNWNVS